MDASWFTLSTTELAQLIRTRQVTSTHLVQAHIDRLKAVNPKINAVTCELFDQALLKAKEADAKTEITDPNELPPLHGVPCTLKGAFAVEGHPWIAGCYHRSSAIADRTAPAVQRLLDAGAIPLCITNVPEAMIWIETDNRVHGRTENPRAIGRTPGGSSGGEAAVIASGGAPFGIGTDFGGSIRIPSFFCGIAGHKPTQGLVPGDGQWPDPVGGLRDFVCIGPMARRARDLHLLLKVLAADPNLPDPAKVDVSRLRVFYYRQNGEFRAQSVIQQSVLDAVETLRAQGAQVEEWCPKLLSKSSRIWLALVGAVEGVPPVKDILGDGKRISLSKELLKLTVGRSYHTLPVLAMALAEGALRGSLGRIKSLLRDGQKLQAELEDKLGTDGVLIAPVYTHLAPKHHGPKLRPLNWTYSGIFNVLGLPATAVPRGLSPQGLPLGVQVVASRHQDHLTLAVAQSLELPLPPAFSP